MSRVLVGVEQLVADSTAFQSRTGSADATEAKAHIYFGEVIGDLKRLRPFALLIHDAHGAVQVGEGTQILLGAKGAVWLMFADNARFCEDAKQSYLDFSDFCGQVLDDMLSLSGSGDYWPIRPVEMVEPPTRNELGKRRSEDYWIAAWSLGHHVTP